MLGELVDKVHSYHPEADTALITRAYAFSERMHHGQKRRSGEPYFVHPVEVASIIAHMKLDVPSVVTGLLHDTVEDTLTSLEQIEKEFGPEIASLVDGVTKISQINFTTREERQAENFRKMIIAMARDIRVILVKLADRAHNMRTLSYLSESKQHEIAEETLEIYAPLAHRLGIYWLKSELEDSALRYLHPEVYAQLKRDVAKKKAEREHYIAEVIAFLKQKLAESDITADVYGRPKHFYSIYQKMQSQNLLFSQIYDLVAFRILVDSVRECYEALGIIHSYWKPVPGRFKDYIALPKANMYQSLHTTVIGPYGERIEVQIRTHEMHRVAEEGIAAHWTYKEGRGLEEAQHFAWLRQLVEWQQQLKDPQEFLHTVKEDLFTDEVYAFTPKGDLYSFPKGASVIDFAYRVHSEVGNHCTGARVNGRLVPLRYQLQNGDTVEIVTTTHQTPSKDWLKFVRTSKAQARIRQWVKAQQRERSVALGRELLERELSRYRLDLAALRKQGKVDAVFKELHFKDEETLLAAIGYGQLTIGSALSHFVPQQELSPGQGSDTAELEKIRQKTPPGEGRGGVRVGGEENVLIRFGRCCNPLHGEKIIGVITRGKGVTIHTADCQRLLESDPQRHIAVSWDNGAAGYERPVKVEVLSEDRPGLLAAMSKAISTVGINIINADVRTLSDKRALNVFEVMVASAEDLNRMMRNLGRIRGVVKVERVKG